MENLNQSNITRPSSCIRTRGLIMAKRFERSTTMATRFESYVMGNLYKEQLHIEIDYTDLSSVRSPLHSTQLNTSYKAIVIVIPKEGWILGRAPPSFLWYDMDYRIDNTPVDYPFDYTNLS